jgi:hypothetical protein
MDVPFNEKSVSVMSSSPYVAETHKFIGLAGF